MYSGNFRVFRNHLDRRMHMALQSAVAKSQSQRLISDPTGYGIVNLFTGLVTPSLVPLASSDSTV